MRRLYEFQRAPWFAIHVRSRHEKLVAASLSSQGIECFLPLYRSTRNWSDRRKEVDLPLFPSYVFSSFDPRDHASILKSPGVVKVVSFGHELAPVEPSELTHVQTILNSGLLILPWPSLAAGDRVYLEAGPLQGLEGVIVRTKGSLRLVVTVSLLQRSVSVEIDRDWVRPLTFRKPPAISYSVPRASGF